MTLLRDRRILDNPNESSGGGGMTPAQLLRLETLEDNEYKITYFAAVSTATGTITKPANSTIILDQLGSGADAYVSTIVNGQPTGILPQTAGGVLVDVSSFNTSGDYTLSGTPSAFDVAIIYIITIPAKFYSGLTTANILDLEDINVPQGTGVANEIAYWSGIKTIGSLATATYPSLTELSYVKGLTSSAQTQIGTKAPTASPTFTGTVTTPAIIVSSETASRIAIFDASKNIKSADTATYPSLTELAFVKGLLYSAASLRDFEVMTGSLAVFSPLDSAVTYIGPSTPLAPNATDTNRQFQLPTGTIVSCLIYVDPTGTIGSNDTVTYALWNITDGVSVGDLGTITYDRRGNQLEFAVSLATDTTKIYSVRITNPVYGTNPTNVYTTCKLKYKKS